MDLPSYNEFLPNLRRAEKALETILDEQECFQREFQYILEDAAFSGMWETEGRQNEISVYQLSNSGQVSIEGYSASSFGVASESVGAVHFSTIEPMMDAQYGIIDTLEPADFEIDARR